MEEKLYFKPANYGRGKKKEQAEQKGEPKEKKNHKALKLIGILLFLLIVVIIIIWLLHGKTTTTGQYPENIRNESLSCVSKTKKYSIVDLVDSDEKELKINAIFNGEDSLKNISIIYTLIYATENDAYRSESVAHAELNETLTAAGFNTNKFSNKFARYNERLIISLTANGSELNEFSSRFFELNLNDTDDFPKTLTDFRKVYETTGFSCESTLQ